MKIKKILLVTGLVFGISIVVSGQNRKAVKAYETFDAGEYYAAIDEFKRAYQQISDKKEKLNIAFHIAECYRITNNSTQAALWYSKVVA